MHKSQRGMSKLENLPKMDINWRIPSKGSIFEKKYKCYTISEFQSSSIVINCHQLSSIIINCHESLSIVINHHQSPSIVIVFVCNVIMFVTFIMFNDYLWLLITIGESWILNMIDFRFWSRTDRQWWLLKCYCDLKTSNLSSLGLNNKLKMVYSQDLAIMDYHRLSWTILDCYGLLCTVMDCHGLLWTVMDCHGLSWTVMDCHGLSWTVMDYHGL